MAKKMGKKKAPQGPIFLGATQVGFNIGTTLPSTFTPAEQSSVMIKPTYDADKVLQSATINLTIPLNVADASILSPGKLLQDGTSGFHQLNPGQIGIDGDTEIFDTGFARKVQNFIAIDTDGAGFLHIKVPITIAAKIEQIT